MFSDTHTHIYNIETMEILYLAVRANIQDTSVHY